VCSDVERRHSQSGAEIGKASPKSSQILRDRGFGDGLILGKDIYYLRSDLSQDLGRHCAKTASNLGCAISKDRATFDSRCYFQPRQWKARVAIINHYLL
jgi:hypothetical protein